MEEEIKYYYDSHATEKDRMGQPSAHSELLHDLWNVLKWLFHEQTCAIYGNLNFYQTSDPFEYPEEPDLAIIKGIAYQNTTRSYRVGKSGPAPHVIFEVASDETWKRNRHAMRIWVCKNTSRMIHMNLHCQKAAIDACLAGNLTRTDE